MQDLDKWNFITDLEIILYTLKIDYNWEYLRQL
jgi:hypothetical protein